MVAMLAFGGTFAYFTATTESKSGTITTGKIALTTAASEVTLDGHTSALLPSEKVNASITYTDSSDRGSWVFFKVDTTTLFTSKFELTEVKLNGAELSKLTGDYADVYYYENNKTEGVDSKVGDNAATTTLAVTFEITYKATVGNDDMSQTYTLTVQACSVQHAGFTSAQDAVAQSAFKE